MKIFFILLLHSYARENIFYFTFTENTELMSNMKIFLLFYFYILKFQIIRIDLCWGASNNRQPKTPASCWRLCIRRKCWFLHSTRLCWRVSKLPVQNQYKCFFVGFWPYRCIFSSGKWRYRGKEDRTFYCLVPAIPNRRQVFLLELRNRLRVKVLITIHEKCHSLNFQMLGEIKRTAAYLFETVTSKKAAT